ncbi:hypothetical protein ES332_A05G432400v1 [Gossypium tomentosum]|uniref:Transmembrane protein n=1 Tax=Gossypium tomentosum TaxID=34277 RepID=A0A5D2QVB3_GOSTO|nr:hypothetical protein ES332_A05G432400v1 [Gossypium tomentosum]
MEKKSPRTNLRRNSCVVRRMEEALVRGVVAEGRPNVRRQHAWVLGLLLFSFLCNGLGYHLGCWVR